MKIGILGASGYTGVELLRLLAAHPVLEVAVATAHSHAGQAVGEHTPSLAAAYPGLVYEESDPVRLDGLDLVFCALPHGESQRIVPELRGRVGRGRRPGGRLQAARRRRSTRAGTARSTTRPSCWPRRSTACPSSSVTAWPGRRWSPRPGATRPRPGWRSPRWCGRGLVERTGIVVDAASGVSGAGRGLKESLHFGTVDEDFTAYGLLTHRHTPEIEQILGVRGAVHPAPRPHGPRHPGHLLRPARRAAARCRRRTPSWTSLHEAYDDEPFVVVTDEPAVHQGHGGFERGARDGAGGPPHRLGRHPVRPRQPGEGGVGPGASSAPTWCSGCPRPPACPSPGCTRERHRAAGASSRSGAPPASRPPTSHDVAVVATADGRAVPAAGVFTAQPGGGARRSR